MSDTGPRRRWTRTTAPYLVFRGSGQAAEFAGWVLLARRLGADSFGVISVAALVCRYGGLVADWGASISGVRDVADGSKWPQILALARRREFVSAGLSAAFVAGTVASDRADLVPLVAILLSLGLNRDWIALGRRQGTRSAVPVFVQGISLLLAAGFGPVSLPTLPAALAYAMSLVLSIALNPLDRDRPAATARVDGWMLMAIVCNQVLSSADVFLLALLMSTSDAGIYAAIYRLPNAWLALLVIVRASLLPMATAALHDDRQSFLALKHTALRWSVIAGGGVLLTSALAYPAVPVLFGRDYESGAIPAVLLLVATAIATAAAPLHHLYLAFGNDRSYGYLLLGVAGLNLAANAVLIPVAGLNGAAVATILANAVLAGALVRLLQRCLRAGSPTMEARHA